MSQKSDKQAQTKFEQTQTKILII